MPPIMVPAAWEAVCKGIFVGGCVRRGDGSSFRASAHAHTDKRDGENQYWICVRSKHKVFTPSGKPSTLLLHEYAHLLAPSDHGHGKAWRKACVKLGIPAEAARYEKRAEERRQERLADRWAWFTIQSEIAQGQLHKSA